MPSRSRQRSIQGRSRCARRSSRRLGRRPRRVVEDTLASVGGQAGGCSFMQQTLTFQLSWKSFVACGDALAGGVSRTMPVRLRPLKKSSTDLRQGSVSKSD